jgi:DNA-binding GntR family transcriptional regulator
MRAPEREGHRGKDSRLAGSAISSRPAVSFRVADWREVSVGGRNSFMRTEPTKARVIFIAGEQQAATEQLPATGNASMPDLPPVSRNTLQEQAYLRLRQALMSGQFAPGQSITLRAAAAALGTSAMPARDALRRLEIEHALVPRGNRTLGVPELTWQSLAELREVRMALEGLATEKAALQITPREIAILEDHYRSMAEAANAGDIGEYMRANWSFHSGIYRASRSQLLVAVIEPFWMRIGPYVRIMLPDRKSLVDSLGNHAAAVEALKRRDAAAARQAIQRDLLESAEGLATMLRAREEARGAQVLSPGAEPGNPARPRARQRLGRR